MLNPDDLIITVCDNAHEELGTRLRRVHWSVPDPVRAGTDDDFDRALADLADRVTRIAPRIIPTQGA